MFILKRLWQKKDPELPALAIRTLADSCFGMLSKEISEHNSKQGDRYRIHLDYPGLTGGCGGRSAYVRILAISPYWVLSLRYTKNTLECFQFPAVELPSLPKPELASRLKLKLDLRTAGSQQSWFMSDAEIDEKELTALVLSLLRDLVRSSDSDHTHTPEFMQARAGERSTIGVVKNLLNDRQRLMLSLVEEQETTKSLLAMEIHDNVIGDLMYLTRSVRGERELTNEEIAEILESITDSLRSVCADLSPRDIRDWGLTTMVTDLCRRFTDRTGAKVFFSFSGTLPEMPDDVQLHTFRIVQECLTNAEKHSSATELTVLLEANEQELTVTVSDNGTGFDPEAIERNQVGQQLGSLIARERTELISMQLPATLRVLSTPGKGTTITLYINTSTVVRDLAHCPDVLERSTI